MKKTIAVAAFLAVMATGSAFATCGTVGDGCTPLPPPPVPGTCIGPCGGTIWANGEMNVYQAGEATAWGENAQAFSGGTYDLTAKFNTAVGTAVGMQQLGEVNLFGGFQGSASGTAAQPGIIKAGGSSWGTTGWNFKNTFGVSPLMTPPTLAQ